MSRSAEFGYGLWAIALNQLPECEVHKVFLTLIRAAGGVYDFRNFEEIYLCNGLSSDLQNSVSLKKSLVSISC